MVYTIETVKDELPNVQVRIGKRIEVGYVRGRKLRFAVVALDNGTSFECAWETVAECLNKGTPINM